MTMRKLFLGLLLLLPLSSVNSEILAFKAEKLVLGFDAKQRIEQGTSEKPIADATSYGWTVGYVVGVRDMLIVTEDMCNADISVNQLLAVVEKRLRENPENWDELTLLPVMTTLIKTSCDI